MRADRLVATLLLMQARGRVTAAELAEELEISVATARRDLEALSAAGIPVYPQAGRGGGWQLLGEGRTDLSGFTASEARALFLTLGPRAGESEAARSALRKVMRALPETFRADAEAAADSVVVEAGGWGASAVRPAAVGVLQAAVVERRLVRFDYAAWGKPARSRTVRPLGLVDKGGTWYLIADPVTDAAGGGSDAGGTDAAGGGSGAARTDVASGRGTAARPPAASRTAASGTEASETALRSYRVDRMAGAEALEEVFEPPAGFDLDEAWATLSAEVGRARTRANALVRVAPAVLDEFRGWVGGTERVDEAEPAADGRVLVRVTAPSDEALARRLVAWSDGAEVVEPEGVRDRLAAIGARLVEAYGAVEAPSSSSTPTTSA
ncbi:HTH domain-containing protein [Agromyces sp. CF514]|uniref:helix-turn-helix transcriptional regulator n=1 Tax=Agromyces sp. CF514 TaxID=1881031 RepID=UPI0008EDFDCC|nr:WYL domain-containing protein [Agromyces sp. CF514]SFR69880.1 HTH domain-containing protein [Agromyces sp. CF514]